MQERNSAYGCVWNTQQNMPIEAGCEGNPDDTVCVSTQ